MVTSIGPEKCQEVLRTALAMGADRAIHVVVPDKEFATLQPIHISKIFAKLADIEKSDLIIVGKQAIDDDANQTAQMTAAILGWPQAAFASKIEKDNGSLKVVREIDGGLETVKIQLPAVVSADLRLNEPRYATLPNIMKAKKKPLKKMSLAELNIDPKPHIQIISVEEPPVRQGGAKVEDVDTLLSKLKEAGRV